MSQAPPSEPIAIGRAVFDPSTRQLVADGEVLRLEPRLSAVLARLVSVNGAAVSRDELLECWGDDAGSDESLTQAISTLRRMLSDTTRPHRVIQTLPKAGYRLIVETARAPTLAGTRYDQGPLSLLQTVLSRPIAALAVVVGVAIVVVASVAAIDAITYRPPGVDVVIQVPVEPNP